MASSELATTSNIKIVLFSQKSRPDRAQLNVKALAIGGEIERVPIRQHRWLAPLYSQLGAGSEAAHWAPAW
jgi:hypothetical protein